jgi:hypothetical protein
MSEAIRQREQLSEAIRQREQFSEVIRLRDAVHPALVSPVHPALDNFAHAAMETQRMVEGVQALRRMTNGVNEALRVQRIFDDMVKPMNSLTADLLPLSPPSDRPLAARTAQDLIAEIRDFQASLDPDHEVGLTLTGQSIVFHVTHVFPSGASNLCFGGHDDAGNRHRLFQHVSQCNVHMIALRKKGALAGRIGFSLPEAN